MAKVLLLNGSPRPEGGASAALGEMIRVLEGEGLETELIQLGGQAIRGCVDCGFCRENGRCVFTEDSVNEVAAKLEGADALVVGSPVFFNSPSGTVLSFLDRLFHSVSFPLNRKVGACIVSSSGGGLAESINTLNQYFVLRGMPVASINYWDPAYSAEPDTDGPDRLAGIRGLAENISAMVKALTTPDETGAFPEVKSEYCTGFQDGEFEQLRRRPVTTFLLDEENTVFPDPKYVSDIGLLAIGGSITTETLVTAYSLGIFPWEEEGAPLMWWCPKDKFVLIPSEAHIDRRLENFMARHEVTLQVDRDFMDTMHHCRTRRESAGEETWITDEVEEAYGELCRAGYTISAEAYVDGVLAGGLYGLRIGRCVFGESMFSDQPNGSKMALYLLAKYLEERNCPMIDCQVPSGYLVRMGGKFISYDEYMHLVRQGQKD